MAESKPIVPKTLEVVAVGEVEVRPQLATITLILSACKQSLEECRASIDKRQPYVHHTVGGTSLVTQHNILTLLLATDGLYLFIIFFPAREAGQGQ